MIARSRGCALRLSLSGKNDLLDEVFSRATVFDDDSKVVTAFRENLLAMRPIEIRISGGQIVQRWDRSSSDSDERSAAAFAADDVSDEQAQHLVEAISMEDFAASCDETLLVMKFSRERNDSDAR